MRKWWKVKNIWEMWCFILCEWWCMSNLDYRQKKIQEKRKKTPWREFVMEIASRVPLMFYKLDNGDISALDSTGRVDIKHFEFFEKERIWFGDIGIDFDTHKSLFQHIKDLFAVTGMPSNNIRWNHENSQYSYATLNTKNAYLSYEVIEAENVLYSMSVKNSHDVFESISVLDNSSVIFSSIWVIGSHNVFYSTYIHNCSDIWFSRNLQWCHECCYCDDLQNQSYCIHNKQYSKEEYR